MRLPRLRRNTSLASVTPIDARRPHDELEDRVIRVAAHVVAELEARRRCPVCGRVDAHEPGCGFAHLAHAVRALAASRHPTAR